MVSRWGAVIGRRDSSGDASTYLSDCCSHSTLYMGGGCFTVGGAKDNTIVTVEK